MSRHQFAYGHYISYKGSVWAIENFDPKTKVLKLSKTTDSLLISMPYTEALEHMAANELEFVDPEVAKKPVVSATQRVMADFSTKPKEEKQNAIRKSKYLNMLNELGVESYTKKTLDPVIANIARQIGDSSPPSWITVYRWYNSYMDSSEDIRSLLEDKRSKGNRKGRLDPEVCRIMEGAINDVYLKDHKPCMSSAYKEIERRIWRENKFRAPNNALKAPSFKTLTNKIRALDPFTVTLHREGKRAAERDFRAYGMGVVSTRPLERVEIDHTQIDLFVIDDDSGLLLGKPYVTAAIDHFTRSITGFYISFTPASAYSVMECLKNSILPKVKINEAFPKIKNTWDVFGTFENLIVDNGKEFYSVALEEACIQLGINIQYCPPYQPWFKAAIERHFLVVKQKLLDKQRGKSLKQQGFLADYDPAKEALITFSALIEIMHIWVIDIHHQSFNDRIEATPAAKWNESILIYPTILPKSAQEVQIVLGLHEERKISATGINYQGLLYNSSELAMLRRQLIDDRKVTIKIDPSDISHIYVLDPISDQFLTIPCINQQYSGNKSLYQHQVIRNNARIKAKTSVNMDGLMEAEERIDEVIRESKIPSKKRQSRTSQKVARYEGISQASVLSSKIAEQQITDEDTLPDTSESSTVVVKKKPADAANEKKLLDSLYGDTDEWSTDYSLGGAKK